MIINGIHVTAMIVDGHAYLRADALPGAGSNIHAVIETTKAPEIDDVKRLEIIVDFYETGLTATAKKYNIDTRLINKFVKDFENES